MIGHDSLMKKHQPVDVCIDASEGKILPIFVKLLLEKK